MAACTDEPAAAKCFNTVTGEEVHGFRELYQSCFSLDVSMDGEHILLGDKNGEVHLQDVLYK